MEKLYYIQNGYVGNAVLWWGISGGGYTTDISKAGKYPHDEAKKIVKNRLEDIAWPCNYIDKNTEARKTIIDAQYLSSTKRLQGKRNWPKKVRRTNKTVDLPF